MVWLPGVDRRRAWALALMLIGAVAACGGQERRPTPESGSGSAVTANTPTTATTTTATGPASAPAAEPDAPCEEVGRSSSRAEFDPASGIYAAHLLEMEGRRIRFDVVQWLVGADAERAYQEDEPGAEGGPPNDYVIRNRNPELRTALVADDARVELVRLAEDGDPASGPGTVDELPAYIERNSPEVTVYWLAFEDGVVHRVCEQYRP